MRDRLNSMSPWALLVISWLAWTAVLFAVGLIQGDSLLWALVPAAGIGLIVAAGMTFAIKARFRWENRALGDTPKDAQRLALRAAWKGPIPADPEIRAAAIGVAQEQLRQVRRTRPFLLVALTLGMVGAVGSAFLGSYWQLLLSAPYLVLLVIFFFLTPRRLRNRLALLSEAE